MGIESIVAIGAIETIDHADRYGEGDHIESPLRSHADKVV